MKTPKIKRYRLGVSRNFPITHPKKGQPTCFFDKITNALIPNSGGCKKLHTCRANYPLWERRMKEVQAGRAVIELFYWSGKPYHKDENGIGQVVFATLDKDSGCGVQKLLFQECNLLAPIASEEDWYKGLTLEELAENDGLSFENFEAWFKGYDLSNPMAIIHFTSFRY